MSKKSNELPENFSELLEKGDLDELKSLFNNCDLNAYYGYSKSPALSQRNMPDELIRWLVSQGADIECEDRYKMTPLLCRASMKYENVDIFLELGANIKATDNQGNTPLHLSAGSAFNAHNVQCLLEHGADYEAKNDDGQNPLEKALFLANNMDIERLLEVSQVLLKAGTPITPIMLEYINKIGKNFEFHRENFAKDKVEDVSNALAKLYKLFNTSPVVPRILHDGTSPIITTSERWQDKFNDLYQMLVPSAGPAKTVQGEVLRISIRVKDEILRNGKANWDSSYKEMLTALIEYFKLGTPISSELLNEANTLIENIKIDNYQSFNAPLAKKNKNKLLNAFSRKPKDLPPSTCEPAESLNRLAEIAVIWVSFNPSPIVLATPTYKR